MDRGEHDRALRLAGSRRRAVGRAVGAGAGSTHRNACFNGAMASSQAPQYEDKAVLAPFLAAQWCLLLLALLFPQLTHIGQSQAESSRLAPAPLSDEEVNKRLNEMIKLPEFDPSESPKPR
jgi:hypothetical protein